MVPLLLFCVVVCIAAQEINDDVCLAIRPRPFAHPYSCTKYYECRNKKPVLKSCPKGKQFNPKVNKCQTAKKVCTFNPYNVGSCKKIMCGVENLRPADFDGRLCSHVVITDYFLKLDPRYTAETKETLLKEIMDWKKANPTLKILLSIKRSTDDFTFNSTTTLQNFITKEISILRQYNFDGLTYFWFWPSSNQKNSLTDLLKTSMELFEKEARESKRPRLILSHWIDGNLDRAGAYDVKQINKYADLNLLYVTDYWFPWYGVTGSAAPLGKVEKSVDFFLTAGLSPEKVIVQLPSFYWSFHLTDASKHGYGAISSGFGISPIDGSHGNRYFHSCNLEKLEGVVVVKDIKLGSYLYKEHFWLSYDDAETLEAKINMTVSKQLGGIILSSLDYDDQLGTECGNGTYSWTKSILKICQKM